MRPILKTATTRDAGLGSAGGGEAAAAGEGRRSARSLFPPAGGARRVTFSPFAVSRRSRLARAAAVASDRKQSSAGFTFSTAVAVKHRAESDARRQHELRVMQTLYTASKRRPRSVKETLLRRFPALKEYYTTAKSWVDYLRATRELLVRRFAERQRAARRRRLLARAREPWTEFDDADHAYVRQLAQPADAASAGSTSRVLLLPPPSVDVEMAEAAAPRSEPQPDLTPAHRGSFSSLLRREGVPVDEDVARENAAIREDLRGVGQAPLHLRLFRTSSSTAAMRQP